MVMQGVKLFQNSKDWETFSAGQIIFSAGQPGEVMYVILEGEVDIQASGKVLKPSIRVPCLARWRSSMANRGVLRRWRGPIAN